MKIDTYIWIRVPFCWILPDNQTPAEIAIRVNRDRCRFSWRGIGVIGIEAIDPVSKARWGSMKGIPTERDIREVVNVADDVMAEETADMKL